MHDFSYKQSLADEAQLRIQELFNSVALNLSPFHDATASQISRGPPSKASQTFGALWLQWSLACTLPITNIAVLQTIEQPWRCKKWWQKYFHLFVRSNTVIMQFWLNSSLAKCTFYSKMHTSHKNGASCWVTTSKWVRHDLVNSECTIWDREKIGWKKEQALCNSISSLKEKNKLWKSA